MSSNSNEPSRTSGMFNQAVGTAKEKLGHLTGNYETQGEGAAQHAKGTAEDNAAKTQNQVEAKGDTYLGSAKKKVGELFGNEQTQAEGAARESKGNVKSAFN